MNIAGLIGSGILKITIKHWGKRVQQDVSVSLRCWCFSLFTGLLCHVVRPGLNKLRLAYYWYFNSTRSGCFERSVRSSSIVFQQSGFLRAGRPHGRVRSNGCHPFAHFCSWSHRHEDGDSLIDRRYSMLALLMTCCLNRKHPPLYTDAWASAIKCQAESL